MAVTRFEIDVAEHDLADLRNRLARTRWPDAVTGAGWDYGIDLVFLRDVVDYWREGFDWRMQERRLNTFHQFRADIDGIVVHFLHERAAAPGSIPLLLLHGWPSSVVQMLEITRLLTESGAEEGEQSVVFDVVAPSLPGYGFSDRPSEHGWSVARIADSMHRLMTDVLGYDRYGIRGSDLGAGVLTQMALAHPQSVIGVHSGGTNPWLTDIPDDLTPEEQKFVADAQDWNRTEMAYAQQHASKPQTLSVGLNDSPAGLAAWILEKFWRWSDCQGDLESRFSRDDLLTNLTIYWVTETIGSSVRLYYETMRDPGRWGITTVPTAALMSPKDLFPTPRSWAERFGRVDRWTEIDEGGHFLEWEVPTLVAADLRAFFGSLATMEDHPTPPVDDATRTS